MSTSVASKENLFNNKSRKELEESSFLNKSLILQFFDSVFPTFELFEFKSNSIDKSFTNTKIGSFKLKTTYCDKQIQWEVLLDDDSSNPPDFITAENEESFIKYSQLENIKNWPTLIELQPITFKNLLLEILQRFKLHQDTIIANVSSTLIQFEYSMFREIPGVEYVYIDGMSPKVKVQLPVDIDFNRNEILQQLDLSSSIGNESLGKLSIIYSLESQKNPDISINLTPQLKNLIPIFNLPMWLPDSCLIEYLPNVTSSLQKQLNNIILKRKFYNALQVEFPILVELDNLNYSRIASFLTIKNYCCLITISTSNQFPNDAPSVSLNSVMQMRNGTAVHSTINKVNWNSDWDPTDMAKNLRNQIGSLLTEFSKICSN
eukprot:TRINITY_DN7921_c0_g1_i1.p1 TRINITY_DN7921_c0_g1~~TRINITY_DN7921_c0_g1_i1.p1  ORF type:complete len:376 (-),score=134.88 TRINITY_DN7921_c0_g1_i1:83-1210(-)